MKIQFTVGDLLKIIVEESERVPAGLPLNTPAEIVKVFADNLKLLELPIMGYHDWGESGEQDFEIDTATVNYNGHGEKVSLTLID